MLVLLLSCLVPIRDQPKGMRLLSLATACGHKSARIWRYPASVKVHGICRPHEECSALEKKSSRECPHQIQRMWSRYARVSGQE